jgi:hypothetical protein
VGLKKKLKSTKDHQYACGFCHAKLFNSKDIEVHSTREGAAAECSEYFVRELEWLKTPVEKGLIKCHN